MKKLHKKGIVDILFTVILLFVVAISILMIYKVTSDINIGIQSDDSLSNETKDNFGQFADRYPKVYDNFFLFILIGLTITSVILSSFLDNSPVWLVFGILMFIVIMMTSAIINNVYNELAQDATMMASAFPVMNFVFNNLLVVMMLFVGVNLIALYGKKFFMG